MKHLAIFASGSGTNAQNLIEYFNYGPKENQLNMGKQNFEEYMFLIWILKKITPN